MVVLFGGHVMAACFPPQTWTFLFSQCSGSLCQRQPMFIISAACSFYLVNFTGLINGNPILRAQHRLRRNIQLHKHAHRGKHSRSDPWVALQVRSPDCYTVTPNQEAACGTAGPHQPVHTITHTQKKRRSRLWSITVFTWARLPSKKVLFYRNQGDVGAFKGYCISTYVQESALFSCFPAWAPWHRSELLKALPCPLLGPLHVWYPIPWQFLSQQFPSPLSDKSLQLLLKISSGMFKAYDSVLLSKTHFEGGKKIFTVAIDSCKRHEKSSSFSVKNKSYFLKVILCK